MKKLFCLLPVILTLCAKGYAQSGVTVTEESIVMPTYPVATPEKSPLFYRGEAFQGGQRHYYPLKLNDQYTHERIEQGHKTIVLENEYIELGITPDIGGKLYYAVDKTDGYNFIYRNNVVKPANIGMTGAWVSGGIEWCVFHHHRASTFLPVDYTTTENPDGSKTVWVAEHEPRHGMRWTVGVTVFPGKSYFRAEGRIHNSSPLTHSFLFWANVAVHVNDRYQTIFPPSAQVVTYHSKVDFAQWPINDDPYMGIEPGIDLTWWKNVVNSNSFFVHNQTSDFMGGYDHGKNAGTVHVGNHNIVKGAKLWEWGSGPVGQATEGMLTETDGPYAEIMVGAYSDNQPDYSWIRPYEVKTWEHYWYPVRGIGGFKNANLNGAVNLEERNDGKKHNVFLGYYSTSKVDNAKVILTDKDKTVFEQNIAISPDEPFARTIKFDEPYSMTDLHTRLIDNATGKVLVEYRPKASDPVENEDLPEEWEGYPSPEKLKTVEEIYLTGKRVEQFYAPRYDPMDWYRVALEKDPGDIRTNTAVGNIYLKNGDYATARKYFDMAIARLTKDYTVPQTQEALYLQGLTLMALGLRDEAEEILYRATWDYAWHSAAYFKLAELSCSKNDFGKALTQINESLATNARNNSAIALKASIQRRLGDIDGAAKTLETISKADPLDFRLDNEYYLIAKEGDDKTKATTLLSTLERQMRDFDDNYLQLATGYIDDGLLAEAEDVLKRFTGINPIFDYYLGYIYDAFDNKELASKYFTSAAARSVDGIFPYRLGTIDVLRKALSYNPSDGNAFYFMGNILYEKQPEVAIENWENAVKLNPRLAVAYRNLGWGYFYHYNDLPKAISEYEKAISIDPDEAIYYTELSELYQRNNSPVENRMMIFEGHEDVVKNRDDSYLWYINNLVLSGQAEKAAEILANTTFPYREGTSLGRESTINANLISGLRSLENGNPTEALQYFLRDVPKEEAGSRVSGIREIQVDYYTGLAYETLGNRKKANTYFKKSTEEASGSINVMNYYQGLSYERLGDKARATKIFETMIAEADRQLGLEESVEIGVIFGGREATGERESRLLTMRGLGYKGLGELLKAKADLERATKLSLSNIWADIESTNL
jgi:tetratricopeptide (TPR) repeat protein